MLWRFPTRSLWGPWADLSSVRHELDRVFGDFFPGGNAQSGEFPAVNIWMRDDDAVLTAELPGIDPSSLDVTVKDDTVTIAGRREVAQLKDGQRYLKQERGAGDFTRTFQLPFALKADGVSATYEHGVLKLLLPRAEADKPRRITVGAA